jgi:hypothetical protein
MAKRKGVILRKCGYCGKDVKLDDGRIVLCMKGKPVLFHMRNTRVLDCDQFVSPDKNFWPHLEGEKVARRNED